VSGGPAQRTSENYILVEEARKERIAMFDKLKFRLTFGISSMGGRTLADWERAQNRVDKVLERLAVNFLSKCNDEESIRWSAENLDPKYGRYLRAQRDLVLKAKYNFWKAHNLAQRFSFSVQKKAKGYLTADTRYLKSVTVSD